MSVVGSGTTRRCGSRPLRRHNPTKCRAAWLGDQTEESLPAHPPALLTFGPDPKMNSNLFGWLAPIAASSPTSHRDHFPDWSLLRLIQAAEQSGANRCSPEEGRGLISAAFVVAWDFWFQTLPSLARISASFTPARGIIKKIKKLHPIGRYQLLLKSELHDCPDAQGAKRSSSQMEGR